SGFVNGVIVAFSGTGITVNSTTFVDSAHVIANITITSTAPTGARNVTVTNPDTTSATLTSGFTVNRGPTITSVTPSSRGQGATNQSLAVAGTNFAVGVSVSFSGTGITVNSTTRNSATSLTVNVTVAGGALVGARDVTALDPDAGMGT